jgi:hypothetical protein
MAAFLSLSLSLWIQPSLWRPVKDSFMLVQTQCHLPSTTHVSDWPVPLAQSSSYLTLYKPSTSLHSSLHIHSWGWRQYVPLKHWHAAKILHGRTTQNTTICIHIAMNTSNSTVLLLFIYHVCQCVLRSPQTFLWFFWYFITLFYGKVQLKLNILTEPLMKIT